MHVVVQRVCNNLVSLEPNRERFRAHVFGRSDVLLVIQGAGESETQRPASLRTRNSDDGRPCLRHCDMDQRQNVLQLLHVDKC